MGITEFSIKNSRITLLVILIIMAAGVLVFASYPSREDPSIVIRSAQVTTQFPGMSPERIEALITQPLEEKIREIPEVKTITSDSQTGVSLIKIDIRDDVTDLAPVFQDLRNKMTDAARDMPEGTLGPIVNDEVGLTALATIALWSDGFSIAEMQNTAEKVRDRLYAVEGIKKIELFGVQEERIFLEISRANVAKYGIDLSVIVDTLRNQNIILPGGNVDADGQTVILEPSGNFESIEDIENALFSVSDGGDLSRLSDVVDVKRGYVDPPSAPVLFNGRPAIVLSVSTIDGISSTEFGDRLTARLELLQNQLPIGYVLEYATYQPELIDAAVSGAVDNLYQTLVIVLVIVMIFLGFRTGLIVGTFVPVTMLLGVIIMRMLDVELQRVSIAAMIIALGMLVDNGIVVAEDIRVRMAQGIDRTKAAIDAGKSLAIPLLTSSLTTILFFVPMALAEGGTGEYTLSLAQVVAIVLLASWFLAMFMTPAICNWFIKVDVSPAGADGEDRFNGLMYDIYRKVLDLVLKFRLAFLGLVLLALLASAYSFKWLDKEFFPLGDRNQYLVYIDLPAGSSVPQTQEVVARLADWLSDKSINPEIASNVAYTANGGPRFFLALSAIDPDPHKAFVLVNTKSVDDVDMLVARTRQYLLDNFPEAIGDAKKMWMGASEAGLFEVRIVGQDAAILKEASEVIKSKLREMPGNLVAKDNWENKVVKLSVEIDQARARRAGVTSEEIAYALNTYLVGTEVTVYREGKDVIPVILRSIESDRATLTGLQALSVYSRAQNDTIPLFQIADIKGTWEYGRIKRRDQQRTLTVTGKNATGAAVDIYAYLQPTLENLDLPPGYSWEVGGEIEKQAEANENLFANLPLAFALIVVLLVWQFNSFRRPIIILLTIPLVLIGGILGLFVLQAKFGFMVILGFFSLAGIILNNGIVLIDRIDEEIKGGKTPAEAVKFACLSRLRPIIITSLTTVLGLLPLIISEDPLFYAMASAMAFGLAVGTIFTLGFIPVLYSLFFRVKFT